MGSQLPALTALNSTSGLPIIGNGGMNGAGVWLLPMMTSPEPPTTTPPWLAVLSRVMAFLPLINTVAEKAPLRAYPQVHVSPRRAAARPLKKTSGEPLAIGLVPWPGSGHVVGSVTRAAGFPDMCIPCHCRSEGGR